MADKFISDTAAAFTLGQTVMAKVTNLDEEKRRFLVTLKTTEVISPESDAQTRLMNGLKERRAVAEMLAARGTIATVSFVFKIRFLHFLAFYLESNLLIVLPVR